jgi:hypothetical protein
MALISVADGCVCCETQTPDLGAHDIQQIQGGQQIEFIGKEIEHGNRVSQRRVPSFENRSIPTPHLLASLNLLETRTCTPITARFNPSAEQRVGENNPPAEHQIQSQSPGKPARRSAWRSAR